MSSGIDRIREGWAVWSAGDLDRFLELMDEDVVITTAGAFSNLQPEYRGLDGVRAFWQDTREPFDVFDLSSDNLAARHDGSIRGEVVFKITGGEGEEAQLARFGHLYRLRNGLLREMQASTDPAAFG